MTPAGTAAPKPLHAADSSAARIAHLEPEHFWFVGRSKIFENVIERRRTTNPQRIGDVGFGTGRFAARLSSLGHHVVAVDVVASERLPTGPSFALADASSLPWRGSSLDVVLLRDVLEHADDQRAVAEAHRVLRDQGELVVSVPACPRLWSERDRVAGHLRRYRRRDLHALLQANGFTPLETRGYPFVLFPLFVVSRLRRRRYGADLRSEEVIRPALNRLLRSITLFEASLARRPWFAPPVGSSLIVVAVKK